MRNIYISAIIGLLVVATSVVYAKKLLYSPSPALIPQVVVPQTSMLTTNTTETDLPLMNTKWVWLHTELPTTKLISTPMRESYILTLDDTMRIQSTTDCNTYVGKYTLIDNALSVSPLVSAQKICKDSYDSMYSKQLMQAVSYHITGNRLYIYMNKDSGRMVFEQQ